MRKSGMLRVLAIIFLAHSVNSFCAAVSINDVLEGPQDWALRAVVQPETPTIYDPISIISSATAGSGPVVVEQSLFQVNGSHLSLNLDVSVGALQVITPWSYTENIGTLPAGSYDLAVTADYYFAGWTNSEEYYTSFEVIPEPATILLLSCGVLCIRAVTV